jgi:thimet oligopeptidase
MKKTLLIASALSAAALAAQAAPATLPGPAFPQFDSPEAVKAACDTGLDRLQQRVKALEKRPVDGGWLRAFDELAAAMEDAGNPINFLSNVHPQQAVRDASQQCALRWAEFESTLGQNETLYRAARRVKPADAIDREFLRTTLEGFEDSGVGLPPAQRARAKQISDRITDLAQQFEKNVRDDGTLVAFTEAELKDVPEGVWKDAKRDAQGRYLLGLSYPTYFPVMQTAADAGARERMWRAKSNEGGEANLKLLAELAQLRKEYAGLFGKDSYDDFVLQRRMAQNTAKVKAFLAEVQGAVGEAEKRELQELREAKAKDLNQPVDGVKLERWDATYYTERVRKARYAVDQESFRPYFPPEESFRFALRVIETMMGVRYTQVPATLWHPDVRAYAVSDARSGKPLATLLVDLYPREGKYNHAAVWSYRNGSTLEHRVPQAALVVNFDRKGLTMDELETMLHELGHSVHNNLSATRYTSKAGTSVKRDFVEAPSQMLEDWVYDPQVQKLFTEVCPQCKPVPADMLKQAKVAKDYGKGVKFARQQLYASYDIALHDAQPADPLALWSRMEGATPLGYVAGTKFPAGFGHLAGGYAAGYYGYLWSLVVAMDLRTAFERDKLDPVVGRRYRDIVLANGSQKPPQVLVKEFLGRETNSKAFFDYLKQ